MNEFLSTKEVAKYIGVNEKKVYFMAKAGKLPCTRVTGKWVFPKKLIDEWIEENSRGVTSSKNADAKRISSRGGQR